MNISPWPDSKAEVLFITGTNTGVGKTVLTSLLLAHLLRRGVSVRALKPFCSGERTDALLLHDLQDGAVPLHEVNPYYFRSPVSPWTAARLEQKKILLEETLACLDRQRRHCDLLIIEGAGGLLSPLGEDFNALHVITNFAARVIIAAPNQIGVINGVLLTAHALGQCADLKIALIDHAQAADASAGTNLDDLQMLLQRPIVSLPFLPNFAPQPDFIRSHAALLEQPLALLAKKNPPDTEAEGISFP